MPWRMPSIATGHMTEPLGRTKLVDVPAFLTCRIVWMPATTLVQISCADQTPCRADIILGDGIQHRRRTTGAFNIHSLATYQTRLMSRLQ